MCQNCWHKRKRKYQPDFYLRTRYTEIKQRCTNPNNTAAEHYNGLDFCTKEEFLDKFSEDSTFLRLYRRWQDSGFLATLCPSIDRKDVTKGYSIDNIEFITHSNNATKDQIKLEVLVYDRQMNFIAKYPSQGEASRALKIPQSNIWKVLNKKRNHAGGYIFLAGEYKK
jgi:hypothetical protein